MARQVRARCFILLLFSTTSCHQVLGCRRTCRDADALLALQPRRIEHRRLLDQIGRHRRSTTPAMRHSSALCSARRPAPRQRRVRPARSAPAGCGPLGLRLTLDVRAGEHVGPAVWTRRRQRQPHVDGELRLAPQALPRHRLPSLRIHRRQMRPQQPACAQLSSTARRTTPSVPAAADSSQPRMDVPGTVGVPSCPSEPASPRAAQSPPACGMTIRQRAAARSRESRWARGRPRRPGCLSVRTNSDLHGLKLSSQRVQHGVLGSRPSWGYDAAGLA